MKILGVDEAGRGCVIGPMVIAGVVIKNSHAENLKDLGVKDSKQITAKKRKILAKEIKNQVSDFRVIFHHPQEIDLVSLNELDLRTIADLIDHFKPKKAIFDVPTHPNGVESFVQSVSLRLEEGVDLVGENKADEKYSVVSAASILAKVDRDKIIEELKNEYGDFGSGYMSDPKTQQFLKSCYQKNGSFPPIVRQKWSSVQKFKFQQLKFSQ